MTQAQRISLARQSSFGTLKTTPRQEMIRDREEMLTMLGWSQSSAQFLAQREYRAEQE